MFDAVMARGEVTTRRIGTGAVISVALHILLVGAAFWVSSRPLTEGEKKKDRDMTYIMLVPPPSLPAPASSSKRAVSQAKVKPKRADAIVQPSAPIEHREERPFEEEPPAEEPAMGENLEGEGSPEGVPGGVELGQGIGSLLEDQLAPADNAVIAFGEGMSRPVQLEGRSPAYTREAREARVEGQMIVKCVITTAGRLERCRILKSLPHMEKPVLEALATHRYRPVIYQGRPVAVDYVFNLTLALSR